MKRYYVCRFFTTRVYGDVWYIWDEERQKPRTDLYGSKITANIVCDELNKGL